MRAPEHPGDIPVVTRRDASRARRRRRRTVALSTGTLAFSLGCAGAWLGPGGGLTALLPSHETPVAAASPSWVDLVRTDGSASRGEDRARLDADAGADTVSGEVDEVPVEELLGDGAASLPVPGAGLDQADAAAGLLSLDVPTKASGTLVVVPGSQPAPGTGTVRTIRIEVEDGLDVDAGRFAATVMETLNDPRGWGHDGSITFARTDGDADLRVVLASPTLVDTLCAPLETVGKVSCGARGAAVLNFLRWVDGSTAWSGDKVGYRQYLVNHEVGHVLGHRHEYCGGRGQLAPLMQQQTGPMSPCLPNSWPAPDA